MIQKPKPTKAETEFDGDCFGSYFDPEIQDCKKCSVSEECKKGQEERFRTSPVFQELSQGKGEDVGNTWKDSLGHLLDCDPFDNPLKYRPGSGSWLIYLSIVGVYQPGQEFTREELKGNIRVLSKETGVKMDSESRITKIIGACIAAKVVEKIGKGKWKMCRPKGKAKVGSDKA